MKRKFNVTGLCVPGKHYMVDLGERLAVIRGMVEEGAYFTINRARQYGKTTILHALAKTLSDEYLAVRLDFQSLGSASYEDEYTFSAAFASCFLKGIGISDQSAVKDDPVLQKLYDAGENQVPSFDLRRLFVLLQTFCETWGKPVVLMIDEVDRAAGHQVFLDFLAQLRTYYLERESVGAAAFQSVILAGVYDIRNLKRKIRKDGTHRTNSPWNIAAKFKVDMSFSKKDIRGMLAGYEADHHTGMDLDEIAGLIYDDTSGYPYLVSALCKLLDEEVSEAVDFGSKKAAWTKAGFLQAERILLAEKNTLFDSLLGKLEDEPELNKMLKSLLFTGTDIAYNADIPAFDIATMFGFIKNQNGTVEIASRIFETRLYNYYLSAADMQGMDIYKASQRDRNQFLVDGHLNMRRILEKFAEHFHDLYKNSGESFIEDTGRRLFLLYLRPIINGVGNYYVEAQTRDLGRTDVIVDYRGEQYVIEMKLWRGDEYNRRGEQQLAKYLDAYHKKKGYMLSFNFNKKKQVGVKEIRIGDKILIEAMV